METIGECTRLAAVLVGIAALGQVEGRISQQKT